MPDTTPKPDTKGLAWQRQEQAATICRDAYGGPLHMREQKKQYLPQFPRETDAAYKDRLSTSVFYDWFGRTINGLTGMVFRKPPRLADDIPPQVEALWENIDLKGTHGDVFCRRRHRDGEVDGHFLVFVDMQRVGDGAIRSRAEERRAGLRPYWIGVRKQDVYGFSEVEVAGKRVLSHLRFGDRAVERDGYEEKEVELVREYNLTTGADGSRAVQFIVWAKREHEDRGEKRVEWVKEDEGTMFLPGGKPMDEIPAAVGYVGEECGTLESKPPHLALALENIKHYQLTSDNDHTLHLCAVPIFTRIGYEDEGDEQEVSAATGVDLPIGGDAKYVEPMGNGLAAMAERIAKSEQRMALLGLSMLHSESRAAETATSKRIDKAESDSALSAHARASQDAFEEAIRLTAKWLGVELTDTGPGRWLALNDDFADLPLDAQTIKVLSEMVAAGQITLETLWSTLQRGELLTGTFDPEVERELLAATSVAAPADEVEALRGEVEAMRSRMDGEPEPREAA